mgnify:FL=1
MTKPRTAASESAAPPRMRLKLKTIDDVKMEMARLYREGKAGLRDVADVSRLANVLALLGRLIEGSDLEKRIAAIEEGEERNATTH